MATKNFAAKVTIGGSLQSSFSSAFGSADKKIKALGQSIKDMSKTRAIIRGFKESTDNVEKFGNELAKAKAKLEAAKSALAGAKVPTAALTREVDKAERQVGQLNSKLDAEKTKLGELKTKLDAAKIATNGLAAADAKLEARMRKTAATMRNHGERKEAFGAARGRFGSMVGAGLAVGAAAAAFKPAIDASNEFADTMVDVGKYVDGANTPEALQKIGDSIREIGRQSPIGAKGLAQLVIGAGKLGMKAPEALEFGKAMETMSAGLDMLPEEAATILTKIKSGLRNTVPEMIRLGDAMNYLGDVTASDSKNIADIVMRQGATVKDSTNLKDEEIAALASQFDIASPNAESAATGMKNFIKALTKGEAATRGNLWAYKQLGIDPVDMSKLMVNDAKAGISLALERLGKLKKEDRGGVMSKLFGEESKGPIQSLIAAQDDLKKSFENVGNELNFVGRSAEEQRRNLEKFGVQSKIFKSQMFDIGVAIGDALKEGVTPLLKRLNPMLEKFAVWRKENKPLFTSIVKITAGVVAFAAAAVGLGLAVAGLSFAWTGLALLWSGIAIMGAPVVAFFGTIVAVITGAALLIRKYWEPIGAFFQGVWSGIAEGWKAAGGNEAWATVAKTFEGVGASIWKFLEPIKLSPAEFEKFKNAGVIVGTWIGGAFATLVRVGIQTVSDFGSQWTKLAGQVSGAFATIKAVAEPVFTWMGEKIEWLGKKLSGFGESLPSWMKPGGVGAGGAGDQNAIKKMMGGGSPSDHYIPDTSYNPPSMRGGSGGGPININVNGAPGQSEEGIAQNVIRKLRDAQATQARGSYFDDALPA